MTGQLPNSLDSSHQNWVLTFETLFDEHYYHPIIYAQNLRSKVYLHGEPFYIALDILKSAGLQEDCKTRFLVNIDHDSPNKLTLIKALDLEFAQNIKSTSLEPPLEQTLTISDNKNFTSVSFNHNSLVLNPTGKAFQIAMSLFSDQKSPLLDLPPSLTNDKSIQIFSDSKEFPILKSAVEKELSSVWFENIEEGISTNYHLGWVLPKDSLPFSNFLKRNEIKPGLNILRYCNERKKWIGGRIIGEETIRVNGKDKVYINEGSVHLNLADIDRLHPFSILNVPKDSLFPEVALNQTNFLQNDELKVNLEVLRFDKVSNLWIRGKIIKINSDGTVEIQEPGCISITQGLALRRYSDL